MEVYQCTTLFCHKCVWGTWKLIPFSKALPGGRICKGLDIWNDSSFWSNNSSSLSLYLSVLVCAHQATAETELFCAVVSCKRKVASPCCSLSVSSTMYQLHPTQPCMPLWFPGEGLMLFFFFSSSLFFLKLFLSPHPELSSALTFCLTVYRGESQTSELPVLPVGEHRNIHRSEEKRVLEVSWTKHNLILFKDIAFKN